MFHKTFRMYTILPLALVVVGLLCAILFAALPAILILIANINSIASGHSEELFRAISDPRNLQALANSVIVAIVVSLLTTGLAIFGAVIIYTYRASGDAAIYAVAMIPVFIPDYLFGLVAHTIVEPQFGILRTYVPDTIFTGRGSALASVAAATVLKWLPPSVIMVDAQIASTPSSIIRQGQLDFSSQRRFIKVAFGPRLARVIPLLAVFTFLLGFRQQELATELTANGSGFRAEMWSNWNYRTIYEFFDFTSASASAVCTLALLLILLEIFRRSAGQAGWRSR